jgi:hypothetical protein
MHSRNFLGLGSAGVFEREHYIAALKRTLYRGTEMVSAHVRLRHPELPCRMEKL